MFKTTLLTAACAALLSTSAHADSKFVFRYVSGATGAVTAPVEPTEPTEPTKPEGRARIEIDRGLLSHLDTNGNGVIDEGETVTATFTIRNIGNATSDQITTDIAVWGVNGENFSPGGWASVACSSATLAPGATAECASSLVVPDYFVDIPAEWGRDNYFLYASFNIGAPYYTFQESERIPLAETPPPLIADDDAENPHIL